MSGYQKFRIIVKTLATVGLVFKTFYFGPIGAGAGAVDGLIFAAIWFV